MVVRNCQALSDIFFSVCRTDLGSLPKILNAPSTFEGCTFLLKDRTAPDGNRLAGPMRGGRVAKKRMSKNMFGAPEGTITFNDHPLEIKYSKDGQRMRCTAWLPAIPEHPKTERHTAGQCGQFSEPFRDKCKFHGGRALERWGKSGRKSKYMVPVERKALEYRTAPNLRGLDMEVAWLRGLLATLQRPLEQGHFSKDDFQRAMKVIGELRLLVEAQTRIEDGMRLTVQIPQVEQLLVQIRAIIVKWVPDVTVQRQIAADFRRLALPDSAFAPCRVT